MPHYRSRYPFIRIGPAQFQDGRLSTEDPAIVDIIERSESWRCGEVLRVEAVLADGRPIEPDATAFRPAPSVVAGPPAKSKAAMLEWLRARGVAVSDSLTRQQLVGVVDKVMHADTGGGEP